MSWRPQRDHRCCRKPPGHSTPRGGAQAPALAPKGAREGRVGPVERRPEQGQEARERRGQHRGGAAEQGCGAQGQAEAPQPHLHRGGAALRLGWRGPPSPCIQRISDRPLCDTGPSAGPRAPIPCFSELQSRSKGRRPRTLPVHHCRSDTLPIPSPMHPPQARAHSPPDRSQESVPLQGPG